MVPPQKIIKHILLSAGIIFMCSCNKEDIIQPTSLILNETFTQNIIIDGHEFDSLLIENCVFDGAALSLSNADFVAIKNCKFKNIDGNAINVAHTGECKNIRVENCSFIEIGYNGIGGHEDAPNGVIIDCYFENCALSDIGNAMQQPHHSIYWKAENAAIMNNEFRTINQNHGNAISHRSSGIISGNKIFDKKGSYGIVYFADHPGGDSLIIENNMLFNCDHGIGLTTPQISDYNNLNMSVRFNTVYNSTTQSIYVGQGFDATSDIHIYGNILVQNDLEVIRSFSEINDYSNLKSSGDIGFADIGNGDLHILPSSQAVNYCSGLIKYPATDIDGENRNSLTLDAGADERN